MKTTELTFAQSVANFKKMQKVSNQSLIDSLILIKNVLLTPCNEFSDNEEHTQEHELFIENVVLNFDDPIKQVEQIDKELKKLGAELSKEELKEQKKKVVVIQKEISNFKAKELEHEFIYSLGSQDINATTRKAIKIKEQNSKVGLSDVQIANVVSKTAKEHLKTLPQLHNTQKKNEFFPFLKGSHFAGVLGCLSFQDLFVNVLTGQMLFNPSKYIDACKFALLSGDVVRNERFEIGEKVYNLIKAVKFNNYDLNEALNELEKLVPYKFDKEDKHPKFTLKQLERIQKEAPIFYSQAFDNCLQALHNELLKAETVEQFQKVG